MRTMFQFKSSRIIFLLTIFFISCNQEDPITETEQKIHETFYVIDKGGNDLTKTTITTCAKNEVLLQSATAGIEVGNTKYKTLNTYVYQSLEGITINAYYYIDDNLGLPGQIRIIFEGQEFLFKDVNPVGTVSQTFSYPENWQPGDELNYQVDQTVYLSPVSVISNFQLLPLCEINIGDNLLGGIVAYIYQPGDEEYIDGETHGIILNTYDSFSGNWYDSTDWANNLNSSGYNDWSLPTIEESEILMVNFSNYFDYSDLYYYGYWSSTDYASNVNFAYAGTLSGLFGSPNFSPQPIDKSTSSLLSRVVRYF
jgi:hypothetical protein